METSQIEQFLRQRIGVEGSRINSSHIAKVVAERMALWQQSDFQSYFHYLQTSTSELQALVESVVVAETWFFRDREAFNLLKFYVKSTWLQSNGGKVLRVLSIPCSTGEEPYSIAIALLESGLTPNQFQIDAVDISQVALAKARRAFYSENSFRGEPLDFRDRYFQPKDRGYQLYEWIGRKINFEQGNILDALFWSKKQPYHTIWCRNLLIYFDRSSQQKALKILERLLVPEGLLFLGYAEFGSIKSDNLVSVRYPRAFAYRKVGNSISAPTYMTKNEESKKKSIPKVSPVFLPSTGSSSPSQPSLSGRQMSLEAARRLADGGNLAEARILCQSYVQQHRTSSQGYLLLGEVEQALGHNDVAEANFRKAIYLEPDCYEALVHLAQLQEQRGDSRSASIIRQRIQRLLGTS